MTEERFEEIKALRDSIDKIKSNIITIDKLLETNNLSCKVEGTSNCKFKVSRFIYLDDIEGIKLILATKKESFEKELISLQEKFLTI